MSFQLTLQGYRSFGERQTALVRPLTILVGENNSGKSSFLAAARYMLQWTSGADVPSFNASPFFLGGFDNIAHYRGGRAGRARTFCLGIRRIDGRTVSGRREQPWSEDVQLTFEAGGAEILASSIQLSTPKRTLIASQDDDKIKFSGSALEKAEYSLDNELGRSVPLAVYSRSSRLFRQVFFEVRAITSERRRRETPSGIFELEGALRRLQARLPRNIRASSPVRTEPERTYDPTRAPPTNDPNRTIFELAQFLSGAGASVKEVRETITRFGTEAGLFTDLEIKKLGKGESDPFRIFVNASGRRANIADVGYGVSQALPILFELSQHDEQSAFLLQQPEVHLHPKAQAQLGTEVSRIVGANKGYVIVETHSDYFLDRVRMAIRDKIIASSDVSILFFKLDGFNSKINSVVIGERGEIIREPKGYRDFFIRETLSSLGG